MDIFPQNEKSVEFLNERNLHVGDLKAGNGQ